jgi:hypothetical protein
MFRSKRRDVVYSQAEHGRLSAAIAGGWGNERFARPPVPLESFVLGVALHDRGYGELDSDGIGEIPVERWLEIQQGGYAPTGTDPIVDVIVATHVHRLVAGLRSPEAAAELEDEASLAELRTIAGLDEATATWLDRITDLCDRISFAFCFEQEASGRVEVAGTSVEYAVDGAGGVGLRPWPLTPPRLTVLVTGYEAAGYPTVLQPVLSVAHLEPA